MDHRLPGLRDELATLVADCRASKQLPSITAAVSTGGELLYAVGLGITRLGETPPVIDSDLQYRIGSITKTFTAALVIGSVRKIHTVISSMMSQACRWGLRNDNPAAWASVSTGEAAPIIVPKPEDVRRLIEAAKQSRRPVYAKVIFLAATIGIRRGELCGLRVGDIDSQSGSLSIQRAMQGRRKKVPRGEPRKVVGPTKSRWRRAVAIDERSLQILVGQVDAVASAADWDKTLVDDPYVFTDSLDGSESWHPDAGTRYFSRLVDRNDLGHVTVKSLRAFMDTYGQELGFALSQVECEPAMTRLLHPVTTRGRSPRPTTRSPGHCLIC